jgi:hypothetical protein
MKDLMIQWQLSDNLRSSTRPEREDNSEFQKSTPWHISFNYLNSLHHAETPNFLYISTVAIVVDCPRTDRNCLLDHLLHSKPTLAQNQAGSDSHFSFCCCLDVHIAAN